MSLKFLIRQKLLTCSVFGFLLNYMLKWGNNGKLGVGGTLGLCILHQTDLQGQASVFGQHEAVSLKAVMLLTMLQALQINQAAVSEPTSRNTVQGHEGEMSNIEHSAVSSLLLLRFFFFFFLREPYYLEDQLVQNLYSTQHIFNTVNVPLTLSDKTHQTFLHFFL